MHPCDLALVNGGIRSFAGERNLALPTIAERMACPCPWRRRQEWPLLNTAPTNPVTAGAGDERCNAARIYGGAAVAEQSLKPVIGFLGSETPFAFAPCMAAPRTDRKWYLWVIGLRSNFIGAGIPEFVVCRGCGHADKQSEKKANPKAHYHVPRPRKERCEILLFGNEMTGR